ncbi:putative f-box domain-containing protein [Botrytis fragariae]|uniref:Putative f-box domain-containing protein n=1 Tax=Botrytis fragariae TaxID=1964551 RepID=A0A8H6EKQ1_9HELO|nr:putative f-box domain-containing protein [Botrytis fragariae]KAF5875460.1 putative f-box domain-containing protein [Botrytis fragariae]
MSEEVQDVGILRLPSEIQSGILVHLDTPDLLQLSVVSKHFRDLAAEELYRTFHIVFPDLDDQDESIIDSLASGLDTFVTSDYDYSKYLRHIILEPLNGSLKGQLSYRSYLYDTSCGKFMNTLLLLTLRKAKALEAFKWDLRVQLSGQVFKELHRISSLQHLHVRMPAVQPSVTNANPSLTYNVSTPIVIPVFQTTQTDSAVYDITSHPYSSFTANKSKQNGGKGHTSIVNGKSPTFSGFKNLQSLTILDMDNLDDLSEIGECLRNSSTTLNSLKLSFSEVFASRSKKPPVSVPAEDDDETETEDEFGQLTSLPNPFSVASDPLKGTTVTEEKKAQEAALGKMFSIDSNSKGNTETGQKEDDSEIEVEGKKEKSASLAAFVKLMQKSAKLIAEFAISDAERERLVEKLIKKSTQAYIDGLKNGVESSDKSGASNVEGNNAESSNTPAVTTNENVEKDANVESTDSSATTTPGEEEATDDTESDDQPSLFDESRTPTQAPKSKEIIDPDDIDIEEPESKELTIDSETAEDVATEPETNSELGDDSAEKVEQSLKAVETSSKKEGKEIEAPAVNFDKEMKDYVRKSRGLALEDLSLYNIPMKNSVISKAIDIRVLKSITLLSVGSQTAFWHMVARENKVAPLPLHVIYTDTVTVHFLEAAGQLSKITELCLLERSNRTKVDTESKIIVTIEQIRKLVLRKHASHLKVLSLHQEGIPRQQSPFAWDLDAKTTILLCRKGKNLEELAASFDVNILHIINQNLSALPSLRALHAIEFRSEDTCMLVRNELRKFTMDSVAHNPECKLEYLAFKGSVSKIERIKKKAKREILSFVEMYKQGLKGLGVGSDSESDSESERLFLGGDGLCRGLKVQSLDGLMFHDIPGVRIFEKDVLWKRL